MRQPGRHSPARSRRRVRTPPSKWRCATREYCPPGPCPAAAREIRRSAPTGFRRSPKRTAPGSGRDYVRCRAGRRPPAAAPKNAVVHSGREQEQRHQQDRESVAHTAVDVQRVEDPETGARVEDDAIHPPEQQAPSQGGGTQLASAPVMKKLFKFARTDDGNQERRQRNPAQEVKTPATGKPAPAGCRKGSSAARHALGFVATWQQCSKAPGSTGRIENYSRWSRLRSFLRTNSTRSGVR